MSDLDVLRRIAERGLALAQKEDPKFIDIFQHLLDEIPRVALYAPQEPTGVKHADSN